MLSPHEYQNDVLVLLPFCSAAAIEISQGVVIVCSMRQVTFNPDGVCKITVKDGCCVCM